MGGVDFEADRSGAAVEDCIDFDGSDVVEEWREPEEDDGAEEEVKEAKIDSDTVAITVKPVEGVPAEFPVTRAIIQSLGTDGTILSDSEGIGLVDGEFLGFRPG